MLIDIEQAHVVDDGHLARDDGHRPRRRSRPPRTVNSFVFLARDHYYDGVRVPSHHPGLCARRAATPRVSGSGGPGYRFADELPSAGRYQVGSLAMANAGTNTNGSQSLSSAVPTVCAFLRCTRISAKS